ncbi:hypothetical protein AKJ16_DCAP01015, partial [Drosera capensis]
MKGKSSTTAGRFAKRNDLRGALCFRSRSQRRHDPSSSPSSLDLAFATSRRDRITLLRLLLGLPPQDSCFKFGVISSSANPLGVSRPDLSTIWYALKQQDNEAVAMYSSSSSTYPTSPIDCPTSNHRRGCLTSPPLQDWAVPNTVENRHPPNHHLSVSLEEQSAKLQCPEREEIIKWISKQSREFKPRRSTTTVILIRLRLTGDDGKLDLARKWTPTHENGRGQIISYNES